MKPSLSRRRFLLAAPVLGAALATPALLRAETPTLRNNLSSFVMRDWRDHFDTLGAGTIIADIQSRALHFWNSDGGDYRIYPTSVPRLEELTKRGLTRIERKKVGPDWTPTASMMERFPDWKYMPPGPDNPLGTHAMYLGWPSYIIHGTHDTRKIGRPSSDGCIGLYNEHIAELFEVAPVGTQVLVL